MRTATQGERYAAPLKNPNRPLVFALKCEKPILSKTYKHVILVTHCIKENNMGNKTAWIIIANSVEAKIYQATANKKFSLAHTLEHSQSRLKTSELVTDKPGSYRAGSMGSGQYGTDKDPHNHEHVIFAEHIAKFLDEERNKNAYQSLVICAEPRFHGQLNKALHKQVHELIAQSIEKDYIPLPHDKLNAVLEKIVDEIEFL